MAVKTIESPFVHHIAAAVQSEAVELSAFVCNAGELQLGIVLEANRPPVLRPAQQGAETAVAEAYLANPVFGMDEVARSIVREMVFVAVGLLHPEEVAGFVGTIESVVATWVALLGQIPPGIVHPLAVGAVGIGKLYGAIFPIEQKAEDIASLIGYLTQIPAFVFVRKPSLITKKP